ncbi:MAG TPA: hypothetical protein VFS60_08760 [Thermoanaerobaculia bacterium]|nr:hypothetical protein [Thermoanaerobaculia bacterium]
MSAYRKAGSLAIALVVALTCAGCPKEPPPPAPTPTPVPTAVADACAFPTAPAATLEETAWQIFVAATCPATGTHPLTFENWTEQTCLQNPASCTGEAAAKRQLHMSHLQAGLLGGIPAGDCGAMTDAKAAKGTSLAPFVPQNLAAGAKFCEEVFVNEAEVGYIQQPAPDQSLLTLTQQAAYVAGGATITFPTAAIEIKADWVPVNALSPAAFDCNNPTPDVYTEVINGDCYALSGIHVSSKLFPNWLWATFEPQFAGTNPNRCKPDLYSSCSDPWGSNPATSTGDKTELTAPLAALMDQAKLAAALRNYRLVGVQNDFVNANTTPLGNSFVEFNAQVPALQASCITCHSYAQFNSSTTPPQENPNFGPFPNDPPTGQSPAAQPPWKSQDFSWLLGILPAQAPPPPAGK